MSETMLRLENVDKFYGAVGKGVHAVRNINMDVARGEIIALLGSSGCGKTSTLRMIAGFEETSRGKIHLAGREVHSITCPCGASTSVTCRSISLRLAPPSSTPSSRTSARRAMSACRRKR